METEEQTMCNRVKELLKLSRKSVETALNLVDLSNCALFFELRKAEDVLSSAEASFKSMMEMREEDRDEEDSKISRKRKSSCFDKRNLKMRKFEEDEQRIEDLIEHSEIFCEQEISKNDLTYDLILNDTNSSKDETVNTQNFAKNKVDKDIGLNSSKIKIESKQKSLANSELQKEQDNQCKIRSKISQLEERKCCSNFDTNSLINLTQNESSQASIKILDDIKCESLTSEDESSSQSLEEINEILSSQQESITQSDASNLKPKLNCNNILELKINKSALNFSDKFGQSQIKNKSSIIEKSTINCNNGNMKCNSLICSLCKTLIENDEFDISSCEHKIHSKCLITEISKRIKDFKTNIVCKAPKCKKALHLEAIRAHITDSKERSLFEFLHYLNGHRNTYWCTKCKQLANNQISKIEVSCRTCSKRMINIHNLKKLIPLIPMIECEKQQEEIRSIFSEIVTFIQSIEIPMGMSWSLYLHLLKFR